MSSKHMDRYGELAVELDAMRPDVLEEKIADAVTSELTDVVAYNEKVDLYNRELEELEGIGSRIIEIL